MKVVGVLLTILVLALTQEPPVLQEQFTLWFN